MNEVTRPSFRIGIFDHLDDSGRDIGRQYADRLQIAEACDRSGFYAYHIAEHHSTPHGLAPSPNLFLAAMAQRTTTLRLGSLVMLLNLYHPLRAFEEICMLDQLSGGRVDLGIGRGAVPLELGFFGVAGEEITGRYQEAVEIVLQAMGGGTLDYHGRHFDLHDVPITLAPVQTPHPPLWYGTVHPDSAATAAKQGMNVVTHVPATAARRLSDAYRSARQYSDIGLVGIIRPVVIAETMQEARRLAEPAFERWLETLLVLPRQSGLPLPPVPKNFADALAMELCIVGTASSVKEQILQQMDSSGCNYLLCQAAFGDLPTQASLNTVAALASDIMPSIPPTTP